MVETVTDTYIIAGSLGGGFLLMVTCLYCWMRCCRGYLGGGGSGSSSKNGGWFVPDAEGRYGTGETSGKRRKGGARKKKKKNTKASAAAAAGAGETSSITSTTNTASPSSPTAAAAAGGGGSASGYHAGDRRRDISDTTLVNTFRSVLAEGYLVTMHMGKGRPKNIRLSLDPRDSAILRWTSTKSLTRKVHSMNLHDVLFVEVGKRTTNFTGSKSAGVRVNEDLCFSLVTESMTLDIETSSKMEREAMAQGFSMILNDLKLQENAGGGGGLP